MGQRALALAFLGVSALYLGRSLSFPLGTPAAPGPGFYPVGVGAFLCVVAAVFGLDTLRRARSQGANPTPGAGASRPLSPDARARVVATTAGLAGFCLLLPWTGYPLVAFLFVALLLKRLGGGAWPGVLVAALMSAVASHYVFGVLLAVPLPRGVLFP